MNKKDAAWVEAMHKLTTKPSAEEQSKWRLERPKCWDTIHCVDFGCVEVFPYQCRKSRKGAPDAR